LFARYSISDYPSVLYPPPHFETQRALNFEIIIKSKEKHTNTFDVPQLWLKRGMLSPEQEIETNLRIPRNNFFNRAW
jgi:hypothetical protein